MVKSRKEIQKVVNRRYRETRPIALFMLGIIVSIFASLGTSIIYNNFIKGNTVLEIFVGVASLGLVCWIIWAFNKEFYDPIDKLEKTIKPKKR